MKRHRTIRRGRPLAVTLALLLVASLGTAAAGNPPGDGDSAATAAPSAAGAAPPASYQVQLITGDRVLVDVHPDGGHAVAFDPAGRDPGAAFYQQYTIDDQLYVIPSDAAALIPEVLDVELFNVTKLHEAGYADATPVIVQYEAGPRTMSASPGTGLTTTAQFASINATAATVTDGSWWDSAQTSAGQPDSAGLRTFTQPGPLGGVTRVWLDEPIAVQLADSVPQVGAPQAWQAGYDGSGLTVAVLDTGVDAGHPDLAGKVVDAVNFTDESSVDDRHGHGTHVAGTIAGTGAASDGVRRGVAPGADIINGKVLNDSGNGQTSWVLAGMEWAAANADVVNMSLGAGPNDGTDPISLALNALTEQHGTLFVVAAGNAGPADRSVAAPGTADAALTVGSVDKSDQLSNFSSRGPRRGDWAIKPEITAPGAAIVAARAEGTAMGGPVDAHYTSANGTSMATPHVAGAVAILLQRDPQLTPEQAKTALVTTAQPNSSLNVYQQGGGRLDIPAALSAPVLAGTSTLQLGFFEYPHDDVEPVQSQVSYTNRSDETVTLELSAQVGRIFGPPVADGLLTVAPASLQIAPGGSASATVTLDVPGLDLGLYGGYLVAAQDGEPVSRIPVGFHKEEEMYDILIHATNRAGEHAGRSSNFAVLNVDDMSRFFRPGFNIIDGQVIARVPPGTYAVLGAVVENDQHDEFIQSIAFVGDPEVSVTGDIELSFDARDANRIEVETPAHDTVPITGKAFGYWRGAEAPGPFFNPVWTMRSTTPDLYVMETDPITKGIFEFQSRWRLSGPEAQLSVADPSVETFDPYLLRAPAVDGEQVVPVVDLGAGEEADFAAADLAGAAALVSRSQVARFYMDQEGWAAAAGAVALLVANDVPGHMTGYFEPEGTIPTLSLTQTDGDRLRDLLAAGEVTVRLNGTVWSDYLYDLVLLEQDAIGADLHYVLHPEELTTLEMAYHNDQDDHTMLVGRNYSRPFHSTSSFLDPPAQGPRSRTEYVVGGDLVSYRHTMYGEWPFEARMHEPDYQFYASGQTYHRHGFRQVIRPALLPHVDPTVRSGDSLLLRLYHLVDAAGMFFPTNMLGVVPPDYDTITTRVWRGDELLGTIDGLPRGQFPMVGQEADYRVELEVTRDVDWWTRSTETRTEWTFTSQPPAGGDELLPMLSVDYQLPLDLRNATPHPSQFRGPANLGLVVSQQGASLPEVAGARVWVSYDDGGKWQERPVRDRGDGRFEVNLPSRAASGGTDAVSVRVHAWDAAGNRVEQEVIRAWLLPGR